MTKSDPATTAKPRTRRMARQKNAPTLASTDRPAARISKLDHVQAMLFDPAGASIAELVAATGWQQHSVRGAMAGALRKRGLAISSDKVEGVRRYRAETPA